MFKFIALCLCALFACSSAAPQLLSYGAVSAPLVAAPYAAYSSGLYAAPYAAAAYATPYAAAYSSYPAAYSAGLYYRR